MGCYCERRQDGTVSDLTLHYLVASYASGNIRATIDVELSIHYFMRAHPLLEVLLLLS